MTFLELAKARYSVRAYDPRPIEDEKLEQILEAGHVAPTARNLQPQKIFVAKSEEARQKLASVCECTFSAPVVLVICYDNTKSWKNTLMPPYQSGETDASIITTHMMLQAAELGIGSCWVGRFNAQQVAEVLDLPETLTVSALMPMGYPAENAVPSGNHTKFRPLEETVQFI